MAILGARYYPVIEQDTDTHEFMPLMVTTDKAYVNSSHMRYLESIGNNYYLFRAGGLARIPMKLSISCPSCGSTMTDITKGPHSPLKALFMCPSCKGRKER